jgi:hypothetical protein
MDHEQRVIIKFLHFEGIAAKEIHQRLLIQYQGETLSLRAVQWWIQQFKLGRTSTADDDRSGRPTFIDLDAKISLYLAKYPFATARAMALKFKTDHTTILDHLQSELGYRFLSCRWIPHILTPEIRNRRVEECKDLLEVLLSQQKLGWRDIYTGDESWFVLEYIPTKTWVLSRDDVTVIQNTTVQTQKFMFTIIWNTYHFPVVEILPLHTKFDTNYFIEHILSNFCRAVTLETRSKFARKIKLHIDNAPVHNSDLSKKYLSENGIIRVPHPPYSPDIAPSDFYLFGCLKERLLGKEFADEIELKREIMQILGQISKDELLSVFVEWIRRVHYVINTNGKYCDHD